MGHPAIGLPNSLLDMQKSRLMSLSSHSAARVASQLEENLLREEARQSVEHRKLGIRRAPSAPAEPVGLDTVAKTSISAIIREQHLGVADIVRLYQHETSHDCRPNKALDPERLKFLLAGYLHLSTIIEIASHRITPVWTSDQQRACRAPKNHLSFTRHLKAALRSIRKGQDTGRFLAVDADVLDWWNTVHCSPFGAVEKSGADPLIEVRLIPDLSFPKGASTNDLLDKSCLPDVVYTYVTVLAARMEFLAREYPGYTIKLLKGDVKGAYRHLITHALHVHHMAGLIPELNALVIDRTAPFGWSGSPQYYGTFGISWLVSNNSPASVADSSDRVPFFGYEWVDDHVMTEIDCDNRLQLAEPTLRHAMLAVLGPRSINETKFSTWETRLTVLGLTWNTNERTLSIPQDKSTKGLIASTTSSAKGRPLVSSCSRYWAACATFRRALERPNLSSRIFKQRSDAGLVLEIFACPSQPFQIFGG